MPDAEAVAWLKRAPLDFMQNNLVMPMLHAPSGRISVTLQRQGNARNSVGAIIPCYLLLPATDEAAVDAYWCQYSEDKTYSVVVGSAANLMFTADMNGCSLGVGSRTTNGERLVTHANCQTIGELITGFADIPGAASQLAVTRMMQQFFQQLSLQQAQGSDPGLATVDPPLYRHDSSVPDQRLSSTTFGIRDAATNTWAFYVQKRGDTGTHELLVAVLFVAGDPPPAPNPSKSWCVLF